MKGEGKGTSNTERKRDAEEGGKKNPNMRQRALKVSASSVK